TYSLVLMEMADDLGRVGEASSRSSSCSSPAASHPLQTLKSRKQLARSKSSLHWLKGSKSPFTKDQGKCQQRKLLRLAGASGEKPEPVCPLHFCSCLSPRLISASTMTSGSTGPRGFWLSTGFVCLSPSFSLEPLCFSI
ncbi:hypothetical protein H1C71_011191, partial [Ictidomys tridecemlineatus]